MKLAVFTDEVSQDLDLAVRMATRFGLDGVELRSVWSKPVQHLADADVERIRAALGEHNLAVAAIASPVFKCELQDDAAHQEHLDYLRSCIRTARKMGTNIIRVFAFWKRGPSAPVWDQIKEKFRPAVPIAEDAGVILGVENESSTYTATAAETARLITEIDSPAVKVVWDPCNEVTAEGGVTPYPDAYRHVEPWLVHLHVKDAVKGPDGGEAQMAPVGEGVIDWKGQLVELLKKDYQGYASLETHWRPKALSEDLMNRPGGEAFSEAGEYASELCLKNLTRILAEARREAS